MAKLKQTDHVWDLYETSAILKGISFLLECQSQVEDLNISEKKKAYWGISLVLSNLSESVQKTAIQIEESQFKKS